MKLSGKNIIGTEVLRSEESFVATSPLDGTVLDGRFEMAGVADVDTAIRLALVAFESFGKSSGTSRADFLERIAAEIELLGDDLLQRAHLETGLPLARLTGERGRTVTQLKMFAALAREGSWVDARIDVALPLRQPLPRCDLRRMLVPLGPVIVFGSSNFPLAFSVAGGDTASALATGNPVLVKAHRGHPGTSELVALAVRRAVAACGMHEGVFSMLHGAGNVIGQAMVVHPGSRAVGFTGSRTAGRALYDAACSRPEPIPVFAEMSSLNPVFLLSGALSLRATAIAEGLKTSMTLGVGQFCTKPGIVFAVESPEFIRFREILADLVVKTPAATMLHSDIHQSYCDSLKRVASVKEALLLASGQSQTNPAANQAVVEVRATDMKTFLSSKHLHDEVFGPFCLLVSVATHEDLSHIAQTLEGQLTASVHGTENDLVEAGGLLDVLIHRAGRVIVNGFPTGVEVCHAMQHGGPYPATTDSRFTSVGGAALARFVRPVCYQDVPSAQLPEALLDNNPQGIMRSLDGVLSRDVVKPHGSSQRDQ